MNRPPEQQLSGRWLATVLALVFLLGLAAGLLLARAVTSPAASDAFTRFALLFLGLGAGAVLMGAGWMLGAGSRRGQETPLGAPASLVKTGAEPALAPEAQPESMATAKPVSAEPEPPSAPAAARTVAGGQHIQLLRDEGKWILRARDILGYESLQMAIGVTPGWFSRATAPAARRAAARDFAAALRSPVGLGTVLFIAALAIYAFTRLFALDRFPINFFADEANQVVVAMDLVKRGFRDPEGALFPLYFKLVFFKTADISIYFHALTASLFGKSITVARGTSAMTTIIAAGAVGLLLKTVFRARNWWAAVLLAGMMPTWLLFSRTTFDVVSMASLYALCIVFYLLYRYRSPRYLYLTVIFGAAAFYAYPTGQSAMALLAVFLLLSDIRYHLQQRRTVLWALLLTSLLAIPFIRFEMAHPDQALYHLRANNSYWALDIPLTEKLLRFAAMYWRILSPAYWFFPNARELMRHQMTGYGAIPLLQLPLILTGVILCLRHFNESKYRVILVALLVTPVGAALMEPNILRSLAFFFPAAAIGTIGLEWWLNRLRNARVALVASLAAFVLFATMNLTLLNTALTKTPTAQSDYSLYGMQWGAKQLFVDEIPKLLETNPNAPIYVTHTWANGTDIFMRFFDLDPMRVQVTTVDGWINKKLHLDPNALFIMSPEEYEKARSNPKFKQVSIVDTIPYPDGRVGFYVGNLAYADNVDDVFAAERIEQRRLVTDQVTIGDQPAQIAHTQLDMGNAQVMFDGDTGTVARGIEANPMILDIRFPAPRALQGLTAHFGKANMRITARIYADDAAQPVEYVTDFKYASSGVELPAGPPAEINFDNGPATVTRLYIELAYPESDETAHGHIFDIALR